MSASRDASHPGLWMILMRAACGADVAQAREALMVRAEAEADGRGIRRAYFQPVPAYDSIIFTPGHDTLDGLAGALSAGRVVTGKRLKIAPLGPGERPGFRRLASVEDIAFTASAVIQIKAYRAVIEGWTKP